MLSLSLMALVLGALIFFTRLPGLFYAKEWRSVVKDFAKQDMRIRIVGIFGLTIGLNFWYTITYAVTPWEEVMAVLGYILIVWSVVLMYSPQTGRSVLFGLIGDTPWRVRLFVLSNLAIAVILIALGLFIY